MKIHQRHFTEGQEPWAAYLKITGDRGMQCPALKTTMDALTRGHLESLLQEQLLHVAEEALIDLLVEDADWAWVGRDT